VGDTAGLRIYISEKSSYRKFDSLSALGSQIFPRIFEELGVHLVRPNFRRLSSGLTESESVLILKTETRNP